MLKRIYIQKDQMGIFVRENLKNKHSYSKSEDPLMHKAEGPSNYFFNSFSHYQAEQIKKGIICVQIFR